MSKEVTENFLRQNPGFLRNWCVNNVNRKDLEAWLQEYPEAGPSAPIQFGGPRDRSGSWESQFNTTNFKKLLETKKKKNERIDKARLLAMSEREVFLTLIKDIATELDVDVLCHKIMLNVSILTKSDKGSLFLSRKAGNGMVLVSKLFDVSEKSTLQESLHTEETEIRIPYGKGIAGTVALTKECINIKNAYEDSRFNKEVDKKTGYRTQSLLCMPILNYEGDLIGVAQIMNKTDGCTEFSEQDEELFKAYLGFCGIGLSNAQLFEMSIQEYKRNQMLLQLARNIFSEQTSLDDLVTKIMVDSQEVMKCQRCSILLVESEDSGKPTETENGLYTNVPDNYESYLSLLSDEQDTGLIKKHTEAIQQFKKKQLEPLMRSSQEVQFSKVFELHEDSKGNIITPGLTELEQSKNAELAKQVVFTGEVINIMDSISDPRFGREIVNPDGFRIRSILSVPIKDPKRRVIGVIQFMNKMNSKPFTAADANIVEAFAIFCGLGVHNCQMYENVCIMMAKQTVALEVLSYHATAPVEETQKLKESVVATSAHYRLCAFDFDDDLLSDEETCQATLRMFMDIGSLTSFHVPYEVLCRWTLSVKKNYRPVTYHNWRHAFNVAQTMFCMIEGGMKIHMDDLEKFGLIVACLCHDLDHRGTNNTFQSKSDSPLAQLYTTSTMEHHHFDQCIMILSSEGNNIFQRLSSEDYRRVIKIVESAIMSTDLALYFKKKGQFQKLVETGNTDWTLPEHKELLRGMMMTACDVSAITKPWKVQIRVAHLVAAEFFEQGDLERNRLNQEPIAMMDRHKSDDLPKMQVGFIDAICTPVYKMLASIEDHFQPLLDGCIDNRNNWDDLAEQERLKSQGESSSKSNEEKRQGKAEAARRKKEAQEEKKSNKKKYKVEGEPSTQSRSANGNNNKPHTPKSSRSKTCVIL